MDEYIAIINGVAVETSQSLVKTQGISTEIPGGATMWAIIEIAKKARERSLILAIHLDTGDRYLSIPLFTNIEVDMNAEEIEMTKSTSSFQLLPVE